MFLFVFRSCRPVYRETHKGGGAGGVGEVRHTCCIPVTTTLWRGGRWEVEVDHNGFYPLLSERINKSIPGVAFSNNSLGHTVGLYVEQVLWFLSPSFSPSGSRSSIVSHPLQCCATVHWANAIYCLILCFLREFVSAGTRKREHRHVTHIEGNLVCISAVKVTNRNVFIRNFNWGTASWNSFIKIVIGIGLTSARGIAKHWWLWLSGLHVLQH